jgi:exopolyphosphatase / guanosine-5'-triphosphate,3'-diphosphate pyrophosphatase
MRCACVDIGSNTTRLLVAAGESGRVRAVHAEREFVPLAPAAAGATVAPTVVRRLAAVVARQVAGAREHGAGTVRVVATAALRAAPDRPALVAAVNRAAGVDVRVLSAEEEAGLTFRGALSTLAEAPAGPVGVVDVGGGSSELIVGTAGEGVSWSCSVPVGSGLLADRHLAGDPPAPAQLAAVRAAVADVLDRVEVPAPELALAVGGSATSLARLAGGELDEGGLERALERLCGAPAADVARATGLAPERVRLLPAGLLLLAGAARAFGLPLQVAPGGLREGVVLAELTGAWGR